MFRLTMAVTGSAVPGSSSKPRGGSSPASFQRFEAIAAVDQLSLAVAILPKDDRIFKPVRLYVLAEHLKLVASIMGNTSAAGWNLDDSSRQVIL